MPLEEDLREAVGGLLVLPLRMVLATPGVRATVPMLRGTWGAALHGLDRRVYDAVFEGRGTPRYILRPAPPDPLEQPALEWITIGDGIESAPTLLRAWDLAANMGLGPDRRPFSIRGFRTLGPARAGRLVRLAAVRPWSLSRAAWPLEGDPRTTPCRLECRAPLRLLRRGRLIEEPTFSDFIVAAGRRIDAFATSEAQGKLRPLWRETLAASRAVATRPWRGRRQDLRRWSARQGREVEQWGVVGRLDLPEGPGPLWPLLAAARWVHVGKGTVMGLGQIEVTALDAPPVGDD